MMLNALTIKTRSYLPRNIYFLNGHALWKTFTGLMRRALTGTGYLHVVSRLPRTQLRSCCPANRATEATESIRISMIRMTYLNSQKNPRFLRKILQNARQISASFVIVYLVVQYQILFRTNFPLSDRILFVATLLTFIWSMRTIGLATIGKPTAMSLSSLKSQNTWPTLSKCTYMMSILNCVISQKDHNLIVATFHLEKCLWNQRIIKAPKLLPPPSALRWQTLTHA